MAKTCAHPNCPNNVFGGGYCKWHQYLRTDKKPATQKAKPKRIKQFSTKRAKINKDEYRPKADAYIAAHPLCKIRSPVCTRETQCVHHGKGKDSIQLLLDETWWFPSCVPCNNFLESHDQWARDNNFKLSKFNDSATNQ